MVMILKACQGSLEAQFQGLEFVLQPVLAMDVSGGKVTAADELAIVTEARSAVEKVRGDWIAALNALGSATSSLWAAKFLAPHIHRDELQSMHNMLHDATGASFVRVLDAVADACALSCCSPGGADLSEGEQKSYSELITTCVTSTKLSAAGWLLADAKKMAEAIPASPLLAGLRAAHCTERLGSALEAVVSAIHPSVLQFGSVKVKLAKIIDQDSNLDIGFPEIFDPELL